MITVTIKDADQALYKHFFDLWNLPGKAEMALVDNRLVIQCADWHNTRLIVKEAVTSFTGMKMTIKC